MTRIALFSDVHGVVQALDAVRAAVAAAAPDVIAIAGDFAVNGADPGRRRSTGSASSRRAARSIVQGNTDIAVADGDYGAAYPWFSDGVPESYRQAAEWARDAIGPERVDWLRRLPAERRIRTDDGTLVLVTHASPGSQTAGFDANLDASVILDRLGRTDARRHLLRPHPRPRGPRLRLEGDRQRRQRRLRLRRRPDRLVGAPRRRRRPRHRGDQADAVRRPRRLRRRLRARPGRRRLPGGHHPHREARPMNLTTAAGPPARRRHRDGDGDGARPGRRDHLGRRCWPAGPAIRHHQRRSTRARSTRTSRREIVGLRSVGGARPQGAAPERPLHAARARRGAPGARRGRLPGPPRGRARGADRRHHRDRARRRAHLRGAGPGRRSARAPTGSARSSSR